MANTPRNRKADSADDRSIDQNVYASFLTMMSEISNKLADRCAYAVTKSERNEQDVAELRTGIKNLQTAVTQLVGSVDAIKELFASKETAQDLRLEDLEETTKSNSDQLVKVTVSLKYLLWTVSILLIAIIGLAVNNMFIAH